MRYFAWVEPDELFEERIRYKATSQDILNARYKEWSERLEKMGKSFDISKDRCLEDFCIVRWADEISKEQFDAATDHVHAFQDNV